MPCPFQWLVITDGTLDDAGIRNQVDLVSTSGFCLLADGDWRPAITEPKGGGVWRDSQLADGRRPADFKAQNVSESMSLTVSALDQDALIRDTQNLRRLLNKARTYGTTAWQDEPVWIEAQSPGESEMRYAIVWDYRTPNDGNPYEEPFFQTVARAGMDDFILTLEREPYWRADVPGTGTDVAHGVKQTYNGVDLGNVNTAGTLTPTTAEEVFVANKHNIANITNIHHFDDDLAGGTWSVNLLGSGAPYDLFPNPLAVGDVVVFGINTAIGDSGPFNTLVFDIGTAMSGATVNGWFYSTAGADPTVNWLGVPVLQDNTNQNGFMTGIPFDTLGVNAVYFEQPVAWTTQNPTVNAVALGVTGYWLSIEISGAAGPVTPVQQSREVYSVTWPYADIAATEVEGDVEALSRLRLAYQAFAPAPPVGTEMISDVVMGLRSVDRGSSFSAYINCGNAQIPTGITLAFVVTGVNQANVTAPVGQVLNYAPGAALAMATCWRATFSPALSQEYYGTYHVYMRVTRVAGGAANDFQLRLRYKFGPEHYSATLAPSLSLDLFQVLDFGTVAFAGDLLDSSDTFTAPTIEIQAEQIQAGAGALLIYDVILIPTDEFATHCIFSGGTDETLVWDRMLDIDSVYTKRTTRAILREYTIPTVTNFWIPIQSSPTILQQGRRQRLWFFSFGPTFAAPLANPDYGHSVLIEEVQRYLSMRGDR